MTCTPGRLVGVVLSIDPTLLKSAMLAVLKAILRLLSFCSAAASLCWEASGILSDLTLSARRGTAALVDTVRPPLAAVQAAASSAESAAGGCEARFTPEGGRRGA